MTEKDDPYLNLSSSFDSICVICEIEIKGNKSKLQDSGWNNFKIQAKRWQEITIPSGDSKYITQNSQQTFQRCFNVAFWLTRRRDVGQRQINIETTLCISTLKFTTSNIVESTLCISTLT